MKHELSTSLAQTLRLAASAAKIGFWSWNPSDGYHWDDSFYELVGLDPAIHRPSPGTLLQFVHPEDRHLLEEGQRAIMAGETPKASDQYRFTGPDGRLRWFEIHRKLVPGTNEIVGLVQDITERKQSVEALTASEARLDLATSAANIGIWDWDIQTNTFVYSPRARAMSGFSPDQQLTLDDIRSATHPADLPFTSAQARRALDPAIRDTKPYDYRIVLPGGTVRRVVAHGAAMFERVNGEDRAKRYVGTLQDVTARWELEQQNTISQARLRLAIEAGRMAVWEADLVTGTIVGSPDLNRLVGLPEDATSSIDQLRACCNPGEAQRLEAEGKAAIERGERFLEFESKCVWPDSSVHWLLIRAEINFDPAGCPVAAIGVVMDITERKRTEEHIRLLMREVNHRSKNMLAVVQSVANQTAGYSESGDFVQRFGERLQGLAASHDLLVRNSWTGVELGELVRSQLSHLHDLIDRRIQLKGPRIALSAAAAQSLGMAFHELATNATKYGSLSADAGELLITWEITGESDTATLKLQWIESGGPPVLPPKRKGFGSILINDVARQSLDAAVQLNFAKTGVIWQFEAPVANLAAV